MRFANPAALWLGLLAIPVVVLHVLRPKRPPVEVSSTFLWRPVARPVSVAAPWQRLRPSALLAVQLLAVALLAAAAAWVEWASAPRLWAGAIDYRRWLVPLTGPAFALAFVEVVWQGRTGSAPVRATPTPGLSAPDSASRDNTRTESERCGVSAVVF